jgi:hypothetical protein
MSILREGPAKRGKDRSKFTTKSGARLDVYECLIEAIKLDPPFLQLSLDEIRTRVRESLEDQSEPTIRAALQQYPYLFKDNKPPLDWDDEKRRLTVVDPHFYFYLRNSKSQS